MRTYSNESKENYLETILILSGELPVVRSVDIASALNFSKPSVSVAMKNLREQEYITVSDAGFITLTAKGKKLASTIYERHTILTKCLVMLGVDEKTAAEDACKLEHQISDKSFKAIKKHMASRS